MTDFKEVVLKEDAKAGVGFEWRVVTKNRLGAKAHFPVSSTREEAEDVLDSLYKSSGPVSLEYAYIEYRTIGTWKRIGANEGFLIVSGEEEEEENEEAEFVDASVDTDADIWKDDDFGVWYATCPECRSSLLCTGPKSHQARDSICRPCMDRLHSEALDFSIIGLEAGVEKWKGRAIDLATQGQMKNWGLVDSPTLISAGGGEGKE